MRGIEYYNLLKIKLVTKLISDREYNLNLSQLEFDFTPLKNNSGSILKNYYNELIQKDSEIEVRKKLKKIKRIELSNANIDQLLIDMLVLMFPNASLLTIKNCNISRKSNFSNLKVEDIRINDSIIESFDSFNLCKNSINFLRSNINSVSNSKVYSNKINFSLCNIDFYKLFLMSSFPNLNSLVIESEINYDGYSNEAKDYKNSFLYLPYSCPNLKLLKIEGLVDNIDFLIRLSKLTNISIVSTYEEMNSEALKINDEEKLKKLEVRNHEQVEIKKILEGVFNELDNIKYITRSEMERIIKLNHFFRTIQINKKQADALIKDFTSNGNFIELIANHNIDELKGYFVNYYDYLIYKEVEENNFGFHQIYKLVYKYNNVFMDREKNKIVIPKKSMLYIDGTPIVLEQVSKLVTTIEDAKSIAERREKEIEQYDVVSGYVNVIRKAAKKISDSQSELDFFENKDFNVSEEFVTQTKNKAEQDKELKTVGQLFSLIRFKTSDNFNVFYKELLDRVIGDKTVLYKLVSYKDTWDYVFHLRGLFDKLVWMFTKNLYDKFELFSKDELLVIITMFPYKNSLDKLLWEKWIDEKMVTDELIDSIDFKCDFKYKNLLEALNNLKLIEKDVFSKIGNETLTDTDLETLKKLRVKDKKQYNI